MRETRLDRARTIVNNDGVNEIIVPERLFEVVSDNLNIYEVTLYEDDRMICSTPDGKRCPDRAPFCKHKLAVMEYLNQER